MSNISIGLDTMTIGIDKQGMEDYLDQIKADLLVSVKDKIDDTAYLEQVIRSGWQGESCDAFFKDFEKVRKEIKDDLEDEYNELKARFKELRDDYFYQDKNLYRSGE